MIDPPKMTEAPTLASPGTALAPVDSASVQDSRPPSSEASGSDPAHDSLPEDLLPPLAGGERTECLTNDEILEYGLGRASAELLAQVDDHLDRCRVCQRLVELIIRNEVADSNPHPSQLTTFHKGSVLAGRYRIESFLGKGGMGEVYAAHDELTDKHVALKTVLCTATDDPRAIRKLFGEVVHAQRVAHPHVFKIYDLHEHREARHGRVPFFTMEFIAGESLGRRLRRSGALSLHEARRVAYQLLAGLSAAHDKGVLHLDFKSDNVMLREGEAEADAVIMDFGLSRITDAEAKSRTSERTEGVGTLPYMAIEQLECRKDVGAPADVYAFGVVLYEMLTGSLPFRGDSMGAILLKQVSERPLPPSRRVPELSVMIDAFVLKCLERKAEDRFGNAGQALAALEAVRVWTAQPRRARPGLWPLTAVVLLATSVWVWRASTAARGASVREQIAPGLRPAISARLDPPARLEAPPAPAPAQPASGAAPVGPSARARDVSRAEAGRLKHVPAHSVKSTEHHASREPVATRSHAADSGTLRPPPVAPASEPLETAQGWRGPPPKAVPRPAPL